VEYLNINSRERSSRAGRLLAICLSVLFFDQISDAQVLPRGVGAYTLGYRKFSNDTMLYNSSGDPTSPGEKFDTNFDAGSIASGSAGSDLKKLYDEIKKFEASGAQNSVADEMNFGQLSGDISSSLDATFVGAGFGVTDKWTLYGGVPFVKATVDTNLSFVGTNNALAIKSKLGNLVFKEVQDGLDKASKISAANIIDKIENEKGYAPLNHWEYAGLGDTVLGLRSEYVGERDNERRVTVGYGLQLDLATGHQDDPDILTDIAIGRGYHALTLQSDSKLTFTYLAAGAKNSLTQGMTTQLQKRVPESDETLVGADRKNNVTWTPGREYTLVPYVTAGNSWFRGTYAIGQKRHFGDRYQGSLEGSYGALSKGSDKSQLYHEFSSTITSVRAFGRSHFSVPLIFALTFHDTLSGVNAPKERYIELSFASFFSTPMAAERKTQASQERPTPKRKVGH
jgi:hypothetical protein